MTAVGGGILWATQLPAHGHFWANMAGPFFVTGAVTWAATATGTQNPGKQTADITR